VTRRALRLLFIGAIAIACGSIETVAQPVGTATKVVQTRFGAVAGDGWDILAFKGIPYAAPPVGELRWKPPAPPASWEGVRTTTKFGADCMQKPGSSTRASSISEDCLTLNIWAPANSAQNKLPVMVFVYGGSFINGSGSRPLYDGEALARKDVALVTFNYRTGVFGFLAHRLLTQESSHNSSGNYGLMDIVAALNWVKENIAGFGGDPGRVTIFGESSGASAISLLLTSPLTEGLFERAILESPGAMRPISNLEVAEKAGEVIGNDLERMRSLSASEVLAMNDRMVPAVRSLTTPRALGPINDGWVLQGDERGAFASGRVHPVPLIVGGNSDEGRNFVGSWPVHNVAEFRAFIADNFGDSAPRAMQLYSTASDNEIPNALSYIFGDTQFNFGVRGMAREQSRIQPKTFRYLFTRTPQGEMPAATHTEELAYVFGNLSAPRFVKRSGVDATDRSLSEQMMDAWVRFAANSDPNGGNLPYWPPYRIESDPYLELGDYIVAKAGYRTEYLDFVQAFFDGKVAK
jgi:carboxylesterase type B